MAVATSGARVREGVYIAPGTPGARLRYLERRTSGDDLVVFIHGMGLDAADYRSYLEKLDDRDGHGVALTLPGFEPMVNGAARHDPIRLDTYAELASGFVAQQRLWFPDKRLTLVGFSLGADLVLRLAELWHARPDRVPKLHAAMLLDPNVNHSTMTISRIFAAANRLDPLPDMKRVVELASTMVELRELCAYVNKISGKNFAQVAQYASDFVEYWEPSGEYRLITTRLAKLASLVDRVRVVVSGAYEAHLSHLRSALAAHHLDNVELRQTAVDHFGLLGDDLLTAEMERLR